MWSGDVSGVVEDFGSEEEARRFRDSQRCDRHFSVANRDLVRFDCALLRHTKAANPPDWIEKWSGHATPFFNSVTKRIRKVRQVDRYRILCTVSSLETSASIGSIPGAEKRAVSHAVDAIISFVEDPTDEAALTSAALSISGAANTVDAHTEYNPEHSYLWRAPASDSDVSSWSDPWLRAIGSRHKVARTRPGPNRLSGTRAPVERMRRSYHGPDRPQPWVRPVPYEVE